MEIKLIEEMFHQEKTLWWHVAKRKAAKTFLKQYGGPIAGKKILDIGCGTGAMMEDLTVLEADVYGLDGSSEAVGFCQRRNLKNIRLGNLERSLPFFNNFFSAITCLDVLEHITSDEKLLAEIYRILKPGGFLVISVPAYQIFWTYWDEMLGHKRRYLLRSLVKKLDKAGFFVEKSTYLFSFLFPGFGLRLLKHWFGLRTSDFTSNLHLVLNRPLLFLCDLERFIAEKWGLPFGVSVFAVSRKKI